MQSSPSPAPSPVPTQSPSSAIGGFPGAVDEEDERNIQQWKIKKLIENLEAARGAGTSMISLIVPPRDQISRISKMLSEEYGTASNIKNRVNRLSVLDAITSTQQRLKLYNRVPNNGLVMYCGTILTERGEKKVTIDFEPFKPVNTSLYLCDNKFHTEDLRHLLESEDKFGIIVMDGNGALFATLSGSTRTILHQFGVDLPKKHGRGGQSALRFARLRMEKRHNYVRKVAETAVQMFIAQDKVTVTGLILAGSADFKTELSQSDMFDQRLQAKILKIVDISYGGETGLNQAIELSAECLQNVKFIQEKKLINRYFDEINQDTGKYCFGIKDTLRALEGGACEHLLVWENLDISRIELKTPSTGVTKVVFLNPEQERDPKHFKDETGADMEVQTKELITDWFVINYKRFGTTLHFVTNRSQEGAQFCRGFGGIGGTLRYRVDFADHEGVKPTLAAAIAPPKPASIIGRGHPARPAAAAAPAVPSPFVIVARPCPVAPLEPSLELPRPRPAFEQLRPSERAIKYGPLAPAPPRRRPCEVPSAPTLPEAG
ncbi:putative Eukaryotic peptide chain release factor subunit 1 [Paratrimastix pyriformis]|uniref:Eukaryotic peptide chain release factor subunit 1 n=1 Tax=Paratrimastix pyriformis TaxID=342808 RepID=A0ABQ8UVJ1_9EUKA|nr:putative Eukaryotic peptide chain release factor subunit 1 [Paratrimastix pyriformis]